jgi:hypothetical protein
MEPPDVIYIQSDKLSKDKLLSFTNMVALLNYAFENKDEYLFQRATDYLTKLYKEEL